LTSFSKFFLKVFVFVSADIVNILGDTSDAAYPIYRTNTPPDDGGIQFVAQNSAKNC
jgi:hypothetical protein